MGAVVFFSYSHKDEDLRNQLETHLSMLKRQGVIETWHDRRIVAGENIDHAISANLDRADVVLFLVSPDFLASDYCYDVEVKRAIERHEAGEAVCIPVILRPSDWHGAPFASLLATPTDGKPITKWEDKDEAFLEVTRSIRMVVGNSQNPGNTGPDVSRSAKGGFDRDGRSPRILTIPDPHRRNFSVERKFTQQEWDSFRMDAFKVIAKYFEDKISRIEDLKSNAGAIFQRNHEKEFVSSLYVDDKLENSCTVRTGGLSAFDKIIYEESGVYRNIRKKEKFLVREHVSGLYLEPLFYTVLVSTSDRDRMLSAKGASELMWSMFTEPLQENSG